MKPVVYSGHALAPIVKVFLEEGGEVCLSVKFPPTSTEHERRLYAFSGSASAVRRLRSYAKALAEVFGLTRVG